MRFRLLLLPLLLSPLHANYLDDIGYTALAGELGESLPDGEGFTDTFTQVEGAGSSGAYLPNPDDPEFAGVVFDVLSGPAANSTHATNVGRNLFGRSSSVARGANNIRVYEANNWINTALRLGSIQAPAIEDSLVQNHSWIINTNQVDTEVGVEILRRFDFQLNRDGVLAAVGVNNGSANPVPLFGAGGYNALSVGLSSGAHSAGWVSVDGAARVKPEIVAPASATSFSTPLVAGSALVLHHAALTLWPEDTSARRPETLKAALLAGTRTSPFPEWEITENRPLDLRYGAGQLNLHRSYHIMAGGNGLDSNLGLYGWEHDSISVGGTHDYFFTVPEGHVSLANSVVATWNRRITRAGSNYSAFLADLNLRLYRFGESTALYSSVGSSHNIEHLRNMVLYPGNYRLEVSHEGGDSQATAYALAYRREDVIVDNPSSYLFWQILTFDNPGAEGTGPSDDPDGDGLPNFIEYALGLNPLIDEKIPVKTLTTGENGELLLRTPVNPWAEDATITIETTTDLSNWVALSTSLYSSSDVEAEGRYWRDFQIETDAAESKRFYRIMIVKE